MKKKKKTPYSKPPYRKPKKTNQSQRDEIIQYYNEGYSVNEIEEKIYDDYNIDISCTTINKIIEEYCKENNLQREVRKKNEEKATEPRQMTDFQIKECLKAFLKDGRPREEVARIAKKYNIEFSEVVKEYEDSLGQDR